MTAPDLLKARGYHAEIRRHTKRAQHAITDLTNYTRHLRADAGSLGDAQRVAAAATELVTALSALDAAEQLRFLTEED